MRGYAIFSPRFWNGTTGRQLRAAGRDAQLVAAYLITAPDSNMIGLYYLPLPTLCHHLSMTPEEARATLAVLVAVGFIHYAPTEDLVWVSEGARFQLGPELKATDKRRAAVVRLLTEFMGHAFGYLFYRKYRAAYSLPEMGLRSPKQGAHKPLRSQEKEQDQEQEKNEQPPQSPPLEGGGASAGGENGPRPRRPRRAEEQEKRVRAAITGGLLPEGPKR